MSKKARRDNAPKTEDQKDLKKDLPQDEQQNSDQDNGNEETGDETGKKKFQLPKIKFPKITKKLVLDWLKKIAIFLAGTVMGALGIVAAAQIIVKDKEGDQDDTFEESEDEDQELDELEALELDEEPEPDLTE